MPATTFQVTLHHLAPDATAASLAYAEVTFANASRPQLRDLLVAFGKVAESLTIYEPAIPEIRVKTDQNNFIIRASYGRLLLVGREAERRGEEHTIEYILSTITETTEPFDAEPKKDEAAKPAAAHSQNPLRPQTAAPWAPRWAKIAALVGVIIGLNGFTAWVLFSPPASTVPDHKVLPDTETQALLARAVGEYQTGPNEGDRRLVIEADGKLRLAKYGPQKSLLEERTKSLRGAIVNGQPALLTSDPSVLQIKDAETVVLYRTTYRRIRL